MVVYCWSVISILQATLAWFMMREIRLYKACLSKENLVGWRVGMLTMWPLVFPFLIAMSWLLTLKGNIPGDWSPLDNSASKF